MTLQILLDDTMAEAREEGLAEGVYKTLVQQILKKQQKGKTISEMAQELEEEERVIKGIVDIIRQYEPDYDVDGICKELVAERNESEEIS